MPFLVVSKSHVEKIVREIVDEVVSGQIAQVNKRIDTEQQVTSESAQDSVPACTRSTIDMADWERVAEPLVQTVEVGYFAGVDIVLRRNGSPSEMDKLVRMTHSVAEEPDKLPSQTVDVSDFGDITVGAVAVRGVMHHEKSQTLQDCTYFMLSANKRFVIGALSDGVSQSMLAHRGAAWVAKKCALAVDSQLASNTSLIDIEWKDVLSQVKDMFRNRLRSVDGEIPTDQTIAKTYGATAEVVIVATHADSEGAFPFARATLAGDGACYVLGDQGFRFLGSTKATKKGLASNELIPLPLNAGESYPLVQFGSLFAGQAVMITSDGIGDDMRKTNPNVASYIHNRLIRPVPPHELLRVASYLAYQSFDDRSAVIVWA